ncbi:hypothetical protein D3C80_1629640 [compost metagenome]
MIGVEPAALLGAQQFQRQATGIDWAQGQGFELEKISECALTHLTVKDQVLDAHTPFAGPVGARLHRSDHPCLHGCLGGGSRLVGNHLRPFMNIHEVAYAVTGTVAVIDTLGPQGCTRDGVQQR